MRKSKEQYELIDAKIQKYLVRYPTASITQIAEALGHDWEFVSRRVKKIRKRLAENINRSLVEKDLAEMEAEYRETAEELWRIIKDPTTTKRTKVAAIRTLLANRRELFDKKFDAGVFSRKLGEVEHTLTYHQILELIHSEQVIKKPSPKLNKGN